MTWPIQQFPVLSDDDLRLELEYCRTRDKQLRDKKGRQASIDKTTNGDRFAAVIRELKKRGIDHG